MSQKAMKILACGDVKGHIGQLLKRVETVNKKAGPFDMVICVGQFFNETSAGVDDVTLWSDLVSNKKSLPVPLYILGPVSQAQLSLYPNLDGCEFGSDICYLGRGGIFTTKEGLKIAYISGVDKPEDGSSKKSEFHMDYERVKSIEVRSKCQDSRFVGVDILISTDWPKGILTFCPPLGSLTAESGSPLITRLAVNLIPRYHFAGFRETHFERLPYRNHKIISESLRHVTRFIGLAEVGNQEKQKWIYAFNIVPIEHMDRSELVTQPPNVTEMPFKESHMKLASVASLGQNQFFYDMNAPMTDADAKKRRHNDGDDGPRQKRPPPKPTGPCWFCLSGAEVEKHLVVSIGEHSYLALPKGGLTPHHVLVILILPIYALGDIVERLRVKTVKD